jgi:hypothetical protein
VIGLPDRLQLLHASAEPGANAALEAEAEGGNV